MGADLHYFSPLADAELPSVDALWLPGGYPELHGSTLANNTSMLDSIRAFYHAGKPILAECGGFMACAQELADKEGDVHALLGLIPGRAAMAKRLQGLGMHSLTAKEGELRGHTYHRSTLETSWKPAAYTYKQAGTGSEAVFCEKGLVGSYFHGYFPSAPALVAAIFRGQTLTFPVFANEPEKNHA
jgi:cobyrinic acid a,c-diamide synthase